MWSRVSNAIALYRAHALPLSLISAMSLPLTFTNLALFEFAPTATLLLLPLQLIVPAVVSAALIRAIDAALAGTQPSFSKSYELILRRLKGLVELELRYAGAFLGLLLTVIGIPWAARLLVRWFFAAQAFVIENMSPKEAIGRSCEIVQGRWWRTACMVFFPFLITAPFFIVQFLVSPPLLVDATISVLFALFVQPVLMAYFVKLYFELRERPILSLNAATT